MAAKYGHFEAVDLLISRGADVNYEIMGDETPLINASEQGYLDIVKHLVTKGADVNKSWRDGFSSMRVSVLHSRWLEKTAIEMLKNT